MKSRKENLIFSGKGDPVLLLHSAMSSKLQWYQIMRTMSTDYKMIACDLYGYGDSPFPPNPETYSLEDEIAWVETTIENIIPRDQPLHIVGHSYGASVSLNLALRKTRPILSLTLCEPVSFHILPPGDRGLVEAWEVAKTVKNHMANGNNLEAAHFFIDFYSERGIFSAMPRSIQELLAASIKKLPYDFQTLLDNKLKAQNYAQINCPVCLIVGKKSPISSQRVAEYLHQINPGFLLQWINQGHMAPIYQPESVNPIISEFIRKNSPGAPL